MSNEFVPRSEAQGLLRKLRSQGENRMCFDCKAKNPTWASISHGIYICFECAGLHRSLGTHLSFVRSTTLDNWKRSELSRMELGGNQAFREWMEAQGAAALSPSERYKSRAAELYREQLDEKVRGHVPSIASAGGSAPAAAAATATTTAAASSGPKAAPAKQVTVLGSKKAEVANAPKGRLGVTKIDTDSFFDDFDAPDPEPTAAPSASAAQTQVATASFTSQQQQAPKQQQQQQTSSRYAYTDASLMGSSSARGAEAAEVYDPDAVFGMSKPKTPYSFGVPPDFDTDAPAKQQQQQQPRSYTTKVSSSSYSSSSSSYGDGGESDYAQRKFANAKSISSDQFFDDGKKEAYDPEKAARLSKFNGARAISSADYFDRDESQMKSGAGGGGYFNADDLSAMGAAVVDKTRELANTAQQWISSFTQNI